MTRIGDFTRNEDGYQGRIQTLSLNAELVFTPANTDAENAPDYRIHLQSSDGSDVGPEVGAGWKQHGEKAGDYIAVIIDDPAFIQPIRANLFQSSRDEHAFTLHWNRPSRNKDRG